MDSSVDLGVTSGLLTWDLAPTDSVEFGLGFGIVALDLELEFRENITPTTVSSDETVPVPVLAARVGISAGAWEVAGVLSGLDVDADGDQVTFFDLDAYGKYHIAGGGDRLGAAFIFGYRATELDVEYDDGSDRVDANLEVSGPYIGLRLSF